MLPVLPGLLWPSPPGSPLPETECDFYLFTVTGFDIWLSVLTLGIVCTVYTALVSAGRRDKVRREWEKRDR